MTGETGTHTHTHSHICTHTLPSPCTVMDMTGESSEHCFLSPSLPSSWASVSQAEPGFTRLGAGLDCRLTGFLSNPLAAFICFPNGHFYLRAGGDVIEDEWVFRMDEILEALGRGCGVGGVWGFTEGQLFFGAYCGKNLGKNIYNFSKQWRNKPI